MRSSAAELPIVVHYALCARTKRAKCCAVTERVAKRGVELFSFFLKTSSLSLSLSVFPVLDAFTAKVDKNPVGRAVAPIHVARSNAWSRDGLSMRTECWCGSHDISNTQRILTEI